MNNYIILSSIGKGKTKLTSFDNALFNSGIANYNLVRVSSILPANCVHQNSIGLLEGSILYTAYSSITIIEPSFIASSAIAVGIPVNKNHIGVIMEHSSLMPKCKIIPIINDMVRESMDTRKYEIEEIKTSSIEVASDGNEYVTAFSCIAMW